jgi:hypothetical protein
MFLKRSDDVAMSEHVAILKNIKFIHVICYNAVQLQAVHRQSPTDCTLVTAVKLVSKFLPRPSTTSQPSHSATQNHEKPEY